MSGNQILRKITISKAGFDQTAITAAIGDNEGVTPLLRIIGVTTAALPKQTDKGEYLELKGQFQAVNMVTGEVFDSAAAILPNFISDTLGHALTQSSEVEFALEIGAKPNAKSVTKYEFTVKPLIEASKSDKLAELANAAGFADVPKLAAPEVKPTAAANLAAKKSGKK